MMVLIRRFEEEAGRQYQRAKAGGFLHLAIGEEATIVGTTSVMRHEDYLIGTYRTHGHAIARGTDPKRVMAELFGRVDGTSGGRGGSMHIFDLERRFMGGYGIVGGNLPLAAGLALSSDYRGTDEVTVCMFGDGASNTGNFGETMNLAALWSLPVVFLVENNLYGMGTAIERHSAVTDLSHKAEGMGRPGRPGGRNGRARRSRDGRRAHPAGTGGPQADAGRGLHLPLPRPLRGRSRGLPEKKEVEEWQRKDPIESFAARLVEEKSLSEDQIQEIREEADQIVREAVEFADNSPEPPLDSLYDHLYVLGDQVPGWYGVDERSPDSHPAEEEREAPSALTSSPSAARPTRRPRPRHCARRRGTARTPRRRTCTDGRHADARGAARRDGGGDASRRGRVRDGRGRRRSSRAPSR